MIDENYFETAILKLKTALHEVPIKNLEGR